MSVSRTYSGGCHQCRACGRSLLQAFHEMKQVISVRDLEEMLRAGKDVHALPEDALLTPSARDLLREIENSGRTGGPSGKSAEASTASSAARLSHKEGNGKQSLYASTATIESRRTTSPIGQVTS